MILVIYQAIHAPPQSVHLSLISYFFGFLSPRFWLCFFHPKLQHGSISHHFLWFEDRNGHLGKQPVLALPAGKKQTGLSRPHRETAHVPGYCLLPGQPAAEIQ